MLCLYNSEQRQFHTLVTLGPNVCGHPRITHGGIQPIISVIFSAAMQAVTRHLDVATLVVHRRRFPSCSGMTAAIIDETLGGLNYVLKREGIVPHGPSFTVHLEVQSLLILAC